MMQPIEALAVQSASRMLLMLRMVQSVARMLRMVPSVEWMAQSVTHPSWSTAWPDVNHRIRPSGSIRRDVVAADAVVLMTLTEWPACPSSPMPRSWNGPVFQFLAEDAS
jgi:hypothetical protein